MLAMRGIEARPGNARVGQELTEATTFDVVALAGRDLIVAQSVAVMALSLFCSEMSEPWFHLRLQDVRRRSDAVSGRWNEAQIRRLPMKVMVIVKASKASEAGEMPSEQLLSEMGNYNEELVKAGIMLAGEGLHPTSKGARVRFSGKNRMVIDGPFAETKELIAGYWIWKVKDMDEAIAWLKRCPNPHEEECEVEIRPVFEMEDFGEAMTPELRAQEERIMADAKRNAGQ
jgi:hypothetical protein